MQRHTQHTHTHTCMHAAMVVSMKLAEKGELGTAVKLMQPLSRSHEVTATMVLQDRCGCSRSSR